MAEVEDSAQEYSPTTLTRGETTTSLPRSSHVDRQSFEALPTLEDLAIAGAAAVAAQPVADDELTYEELQHLLQCERRKSESLEHLFNAYQMECESEMRRLRRERDEALVAHGRERRVSSGSMPRRSMLAPSENGHAPSPHVPVVAGTIVKPIDTDALRVATDRVLAFMEAQERRAVEELEAVRAKALLCTRRIGVLHSALAAPCAEGGSAAGATWSPLALRQRVSELEGDLKACRKDLAAERERSAALDQLSAQLIRSAQAQYVAPKGAKAAKGPSKAVAPNGPTSVRDKSRSPSMAISADGDIAVELEEPEPAASIGPNGTAARDHERGEPLSGDVDGASEIATEGDQRSETAPHGASAVASESDEINDGYADPRSYAPG